MQPNKAKRADMCRWINDLPDYLHAQYETLVFISDRSHMTQSLPKDQRTLYVCSDWLLWQQLVDEGQHVVHYELGILDSVIDKADLNNLQIRSNDWIFAYETNPTLFEGVSIGHTLTAEVYYALVTYYKFKLTIGGLAKRFGARSIIFFDLRTDVNFISRDMRRRAISIITDELGLSFEDQSSTSSEGRQIAEEVVHRRVQKPALVVAGIVFDFLMENLTRVSAFFRKKKLRVMILVNRNIITSLLSRIDQANCTIGLLCRTPERSTSNFTRFLRSGVSLLANPHKSLTRAEKARVADICATLEGLPLKAKTAEQRFVYETVAMLATTTNRLFLAAEAIKSASRLFDRFKPERIVLDGVKNLGPRAMVEVAHRRNIEVDYIWHSPVAPNITLLDAIGGDERITPRVTRCLTWGSINEKWLDAMKSEQPRVMTGSPTADRYAASTKTAATGMLTSGGKLENVLVLLYTPQTTDVYGLNSNIYHSFVETMTLLKAKGIRNIRFKLHPGPGRWKKEYFEDIQKHFGFECEILKMEPFKDCVEWADAVIGPLASGAFPETLAAGKPYYAVLLNPHTKDISFYDDFPIFETSHEACTALLESRALDGAGLLDKFYSLNTSSSNAERFWNAVSAPLIYSRSSS